MANALVTGGAGFIGSHVAEGMVKRGIRTKVLDNFSTGKRENLDGIDGVEIIEGDIRDYETVRSAMEGVDLVFHMAALASVTESVRDPVRSNQINLGGTVQVLLAAKDAGVQKVVYAGSSSAYGDTEDLPKVESMRESPISPYAVNKMAGEKYCTVFGKVYGLETVVLRYFNVFGPRQDPSSPYSGVISLFIMKLLNGQRPVIYGDGEQTRDFVFVGNVVMANIFASVSRVGGGEVFNVATGEGVTINELLRIIQELLGMEDVKPIYREPRKGDPRHSLADVGKAQKAFGYWPVTGLREGLKQTIDWYRKRVDSSDGPLEIC
jgi:UDP-glucose 4-epimerase